MSRTRYRYGVARQPHFLTCTVVAWLPVFTRPSAVQIVLDSWRYLIEHDRLTLLGYVILENHLHFIAAVEDLGKEVGDFKSFTAKQLVGLLEQGGPTRSSNSCIITSCGTRPTRSFRSGRRGVARRRLRTTRCSSRS